MVTVEDLCYGFYHNFEFKKQESYTEELSSKQTIKYTAHP